MIVTTLTEKHTTTVFMEHVKELRLEPGSKLKQWVEGRRIIMEPIEDVMTAFGALSLPEKANPVSAKEEAAGMEAAVAAQVAAKAGVQ